MGKSERIQRRVFGRLGSSVATGLITLSLLTGLTVAGDALPASAGLLNGVLCPVTGTLHGLLGVVTAGWDDGATTPPATMSQVNDAIGATQLQSQGVTGCGGGGRTDRLGGGSSRRPDRAGQGHQRSRPVVRVAGRNRLP